MNVITASLEAALGVKYTLERELDQGGMSVVYAARDLRHARRVAIKVFRPDLSALLGAERFLAEIKISAALQHPHILPLFDSGAAEGLLYYVMPLVEGESLRAKIKRERLLNIDDAVRIATQVANALDYAHRHGVIHRDIKPENILLQDGEVLVADFGIALAVQQSGGDRLTGTGMSLGTPQYMSPEQAMGDANVDLRSDIYSLGAVLYEMIAGAPPHVGPTAQAIVARILTERPRPLRELRDRAPRHVVDAADRALARIPADRFASAAELADALARPSATTIGDSVTVGPPGVRRSQWVRVGAATLLIAGAGTAGGYLQARRTVAAPSPVRFTIPVKEPQLDRILGQLPLLALSHDGKSLVFTEDGRLRIRSLDRFTSDSLPGTEGASIPAFSPDGKWIVFAQAGMIRKIAATGGPVVDIVRANCRLGIQWAADDYLYFSAGIGEGGIWRVKASGGPIEVVTRPDSSEMEHGWPQLLPDGKHLLYTVLGPSGGPVDARLVVDELGSRKPRTLVERAVSGRFVAPGSLVYVTGNGAAFTVGFKPGDAAVSGAPVPLVDIVTLAVWGGGVLLATSEAGTIAYVPGTAVQHHLMRLADRTGREQRVLGPPRNVRGAVFSPDGHSLAVTVREPGQNNIWLFSSTTDNAQRLTLGPAEEEMPVWSADGKTVAYTSTRRVITRTLGGAADARGPIRTWSRHLHLSSWSPDGHWFAAYDYEPTANENVWALSSDGRDSLPVAVTPAQELNAVFSPNGKWVAYQSNESGRFEIYVVSFPKLDVKRQVSVSGGRIPRWDASGTALYFLRADTLMTVPVRADAGFEIAGSPASLFSTAAFDYDVAPDGRSFLLEVPNPNAPALPLHVVMNALGHR